MKPCSTAAYFRGKSLLAKHGGKDKAPLGPVPSLSLTHGRQHKIRRRVGLSFWMALEVLDMAEEVPEPTYLAPDSLHAPERPALRIRINTSRVSVPQAERYSEQHQLDCTESTLSG